MISPETHIPSVTLNDSSHLPAIGFGAMIYDAQTARTAVADAIDTGYRLIDTAEAYHNEEAVGRAIADSRVPRGQITLTTKVWPSPAMGYDEARAHVLASLGRLGVERIDLVLLHEPYGDTAAQWRALEDLRDEGKIRSIGVSNYDASQLHQLLQTARVRPVVDQIESHPWFNQNALVDECLRLGIVPQAWSALAEGRNGIFTNPVLAHIAAAHTKSVAQVVLRWDVQRGLVPLAKSTHAARMRENADIFDFTLSNEEIDRIDGLDMGRSLYPGY
jgi:2,5-diketo-D-gluconate reductase A